MVKGIISSVSSFYLVWLGSFCFFERATSGVVASKWKGLFLVAFFVCDVFPVVSGMFCVRRTTTRKNGKKKSLN